MDRRLIPAPLRADKRLIGGEAPGLDGGGVNHGDHPVNRHPALHLRPVEGAHQRLRQSQPGCFDDNMFGRRGALQKGGHGGNEIIGDGAADAAIGQLDHVIVRAPLHAAALQQLAVNAKVAKFIDNQRNPPAARILQHMTDHRRLARPQKAGDDRRWNSAAHKTHPSKTAAPHPPKIGFRLKHRPPRLSTPQAPPQVIRSGPFRPVRALICASSSAALITGASACCGSRARLAGSGS